MSDSEGSLRIKEQGKEGEQCAMIRKKGGRKAKERASIINKQKSLPFQALVSVLLFHFFFYQSIERILLVFLCLRTPTESSAVIFFSSNSSTFLLKRRSV